MHHAGWLSRAPFRNGPLVVEQGSGVGTAARFSRGHAAQGLKTVVNSRASRSHAYECERFATSLAPSFARARWFLRRREPRFLAASLDRRGLRLRLLPFACSAVHRV